MQRSRIILMLAMLVLAATALSATPASADPVELEDRASGDMCDDTTEGYCEGHGYGTGTLVLHTFLGEFSYNCDVESVARVQSDGTGSTVSVSVTDAGSSNCDEDLDACELPATGEVSHDGAGTENSTVDFCIDPPIVGTCEGNLHSELIKNGDDYSVELDDVEIEGDPNCEFSGDGTTEDPDGVEIHHL